MGKRVQSYLAPPRIGSPKPRTTKPGQEEPEKLAEAEERAMAMIRELREGKCDLLGAKMMAHIPKSWPKTVLTKLWPAFTERWGPVVNQRSLGAFKDPATGHIRVWVRLEMRNASRSIHVAFLGDELNIFDLKAKDYPAEALVAPVKKGKLVAFDFQADPPFELQLKGRGKSRTLEMETRPGPKLTFTFVE